MNQDTFGKSLYCRRRHAFIFQQGDQRRNIVPAFHKAQMRDGIFRRQAFQCRFPRCNAAQEGGLDFGRR